MTEKYLTQLAKALAISRPCQNTTDMDQWLQDVDAIANVCAANNPRFKRGLFIAACKTW